VTGGGGRGVGFDGRTGGGGGFWFGGWVMVGRGAGGDFSGGGGFWFGGWVMVGRGGGGVCFGGAGVIAGGPGRDGFCTLGMISFSTVPTGGGAGTCPGGVARALPEDPPGFVVGGIGEALGDGVAAVPATDAGGGDSPAPPTGPPADCHEHPLTTASTTTAMPPVRRTDMWTP